MTNGYENPRKKANGSSQLNRGEVARYEKTTAHQKQKMSENRETNRAIGGLPFLFSKF